MSIVDLIDAEKLFKKSSNSVIYFSRSSTSASVQILLPIPFTGSVARRR
jgi:hypothetical protein